MSQTLRWNQQVFSEASVLLIDALARTGSLRSLSLAEISPNETLSPRLGCYLQACREACHNHLPAEHVD
jgi:hypothetical protein